MDSILNSTKKILGLAQDYTPFDLDVITHINAAFSTLDQLGVGPAGGLFIEDSTATWDEFDVPANQLNMVKSYFYLYVRMLFDPPQTSFHIAAMERQLKEFEWRLNVLREDLLVDAEIPEDVVLDGGPPCSDPQFYEFRFKRGTAAQWSALPSLLARESLVYRSTPMVMLMLSSSATEFDSGMI